MRSREQRRNLRRIRRWEAGKEVPTWTELEDVAGLLRTTAEELAGCDRAEYDRTFPDAKARGVPWWRRG